MVGDEPGEYSSASPAFPVRSMYAGQLANLSGPVGEGTGVGEAGAGVALPGGGGGAAGGGVGIAIEAAAAGWLASLVLPVHAARKAATPPRAAPLRRVRRERWVGMRSVMWLLTPCRRPRPAP